MGKNIDKAKGRIKQAAGSLTDNESLRREGVADEVSGDAKGVVESAGRAIKEAGRAIKHATK